MKTKLPLAGLALAASALTGVGAGAIALAPTVASAQETQAPNNDQQQAPNGQNQDREGPGRAHHGPKLEAAAEAIGIEVDALREALQSGQTVAQVAQAHNVSVDTVIDAMVKDAREHITAFVNGEKPERPADAPNQGDQPNQQDGPPAGSNS